MRVLFLVKTNETYGFESYCRRNSGLYNSTEYVAAGLRERGFDAQVVECQDNNSIDREVSRFRPDLCIIEALWVVPEKFGILQRLHPRVKWFVNLHSNVPFLACEGIAVSWIKEYVKRSIGIITNSTQMQEAVRIIVDSGSDVYFCPNVYERSFSAPKHAPKGQVLNIGCFGAIRPMKNHLIQAVSALQFAREQGKYLRFHVNGFRVEGGAEVLKNLKALFCGSDGELVLHPWLEPDAFVVLLHTTIDLGMQVSLSETFNVVTADYVSSGLPVVVSPEISWVSKRNQVPCDSVSQITTALRRVWGNRLLTRWNQRLLRNFTQRSLGLWVGFCVSHG